MWYFFLQFGTPVFSLLCFAHCAFAFVVTLCAHVTVWPHYSVLHTGKNSSFLSASTSRTAGVSSGLSEKIDGDGIHRRPIRSGTRGLLTEEAGGMWLTAASRYVSHQLIMSAWRRKPVVLFTILAVTLLVLFVQYSQVVGEPRTPRIGSASANGNNNGFKVRKYQQVCPSSLQIVS